MPNICWISSYLSPVRSPKKKTSGPPPSATSTPDAQPAVPPQTQKPQKSTSLSLFYKKGLLLLYMLKLQSCYLSSWGFGAQHFLKDWSRICSKHCANPQLPLEEGVKRCQQVNACALHTLQFQTEDLPLDCKNGLVGSDGGFFYHSIPSPAATINRCHGKLQNWASMYGASPECFPNAFPKLTFFSSGVFLSLLRCVCVVTLRRFVFQMFVQTLFESA